MYEPDEQELIRAILEANVGKEYDTGMTAAEMSDKSGVSVQTIRRRLKRLVDSGIAEPVYVQRKALHYELTGIMYRTVGYRIKEQD